MQEGKGVAIAMEIYEKIRYYHEHTELSQRNVAKMLPENNIIPPIRSTNAW